MKKTILVLAMVFAVAGLQIAPSAFAQSSVVGPTGSSGATVPTFLEFSLTMVKQMNADTGESDPWTQGTVQATPNFDFGTLRKVLAADGSVLYMRGQYYYYVLMLCTTSGRRYMITETGTQLVGPGGVTINRNSVLLVPDYQWLDTLGGVSQLGPPNGAALGPVNSACLTNSLVYQSGSDGASRIIRGIIAIAGPAAGDTFPSNYSLGHNGATGQGTKNSLTTWVPITTSQASGSYSGTMTFTLVLD